MKAILSLLLLTSCFSSQVDTVFTPYVDRFIAEGEKRGVYLSLNDWSIQFEELEDTYGRTIYNRKLILIDPEIWSNELLREYVIFHELGHALLNREHLQDYVIVEHDPGLVLENYNVICTERYISIMAFKVSKWTIGCGFYELYFEEYMDELFNPQTR